MKLPFTIEQFLGVFITYNNSIWPGQLLLIALALGVILTSIRKFRLSDRFISSSLAFLWFWTGIVYHITFFSAINPAALIFGAGCILQGILFVWVAFQNKISYSADTQWRGLLGGILLLYSLIIYPGLGYIFGHIYPASPTFGAPCPTTIFTFGILLWSKRLPRYILIIPAIWSLIGFSAALTMSIYEDVGLLISGVLSVVVLVFFSKKNPAIS